MDFEDYLQHLSDGLKDLSVDIQKIIVNNKDKDKKDFKDVSLKSLQPVTKMYKNEKEIKEAKENPEVDFIVKQIEKVVKG